LIYHGENKEKSGAQKTKEIGVNMGLGMKVK